MSDSADLFFSACTKGDAETVRLLLTEQPSLVAAREKGDNATPLHIAAGCGHAAIVQLLLDAGADPSASGDDHNQDVIGWATGWGAVRSIRHDIVSMLVERGAKHHIFSAITLGDSELIRSVVRDDPEALSRRMSRFEQAQSPLHYALSRGRKDILQLLVELGAELEATDASGKTALGAAVLAGDEEATRILTAAGAKPPAPPEPPPPGVTMKTLASSVAKQIPMIRVPDVGATLQWYVSLGFEEMARYGEEGALDFAMARFGNAEFMFIPGEPVRQGLSLWLYTDRVDDFYKILRAHQPPLHFSEDINDTFYGAREFGIRDLNGYTLYFIQAAEIQVAE